MKRRNLSLSASIMLFLAIGMIFVASGNADNTSNKVAAKNVSFSKDVAPVSFTNRAESHRAAESGPFSLLRDKAVRPWAKSISEKVANRTMPPWHADAHFGDFQNNRPLSQSDIDKIVAWVDGGAAEGDP